MIIYVDVDGTLCTTVGSDYEHAVVFSRNQKVIDKVNKLFDKGHTIVICTARGATTGIDWTELTKSQLAEWGVKYHRLENKPFYDLLIDDKAEHPLDWILL